MTAAVQNPGPGGGGRGARSAARTWWWRSTRAVAKRALCECRRAPATRRSPAPRASALGGLHPRRPPADRDRRGRVGARAWPRPAPARSCSPAWTATARRAATTSTLLRAVADAVSIPVIASGGGGSAEDLAAALDDGPEGGHCQAALAASIFHFKETTVGEVKRRLLELGIPVRPPPAARRPVDALPGAALACAARREQLRNVRIVPACFRQLGAPSSGSNRPRRMRRHPTRISVLLATNTQRRDGPRRAPPASS